MINVCLSGQICKYLYSYIISLNCGCVANNIIETLISERSISIRLAVILTRVGDYLRFVHVVFTWPLAHLLLLRDFSTFQGLQQQSHRAITTNDTSILSDLFDIQQQQLIVMHSNCQQLVYVWIHLKFEFAFIVCITEIYGISSI